MDLCLHRWFCSRSHVRWERWRVLHVQWWNGTHHHCHRKIFHQLQSWSWSFQKSCNWDKKQPTTNQAQCGHLHRFSSVLSKLQNPRQKDLNEVETALVNIAAQTNLTLQWIPAHCGIQENDQADQLAKEEGQLDQVDRYTSYTNERTIIKTLSKKKWKQQYPNSNQSDTPLTPMKGPSSKLSPRKNGNSSTQTLTSQATSTNWTGQSGLFYSGWELGTTDLMPTYTRSRLASLRCAHAMQTSWLQNVC